MKTRFADFLEESPRAGTEKMMIASDLDVELFLPLEMMFEILSRLTVASLLRCKSVCKRWNEIIQHPKFIKLHRIRSTEHKLIEINRMHCTTRISQCTPKDRAEESFIILDSCNGLLLEKGTVFGMYRVRNPATKQILPIPDPEEEPIAMIIVFFPSTNSYKLVYIYEISGDVFLNIGFKFLSFGGSDLSWRTLGNSYLCKLDGIKQRISLVMGAGYGSLYVLGLYEDGSRDSQINYLDFETEMFSVIIVPHSLFRNWRRVEMAKWDEKVAVMNIVEGDLHIWVLEDPIRGKWAQKKITIPLTFLRDNPDMKEGLMLVPYLVSRDEIWFTKDNVNALVYHIRSKHLQESTLSTTSEKTSTCNVTYTLVTLKGMQPEKKQHSDKVNARPLKFVYPPFIKVYCIFLIINMFSWLTIRRLGWP